MRATPANIEFMHFMGERSPYCGHAGQRATGEGENEQSRRASAIRH
jgi:hypothetical protein